jgi:hypothetical protein
MSSLPFQANEPVHTQKQPTLKNTNRGLSTKSSQSYFQTWPSPCPQTASAENRVKTLVQMYKNPAEAGFLQPAE